MSSASVRLNRTMLGVAGIVLIVIVGFSYAQWSRYNRANQEAAQTTAALDSIDRLLSDLVDAETGQRGFLLTGEDRYRQPYDQASARIPGDLASVRTLVAVRRSESAAVDRLNALVRQRLDELRRTIAVRQTGGADAARAEMLRDHDRQTMSEVRALSTQIERDEHSRRERSSLEGQAAAQTALLITIAGSLVILFFFAIGLEPFRAREGGPAERRWIVRYGAAILAVAAATLLRFALVPLLGNGDDLVPFITYFPAVLFAAWYGGFRAGALGILLSAVMAAYFFLAPVRSFRVRNPGELISLLIFVIVGFGIAFMSDSQRRALARAGIAEDAERQERKRFETTLASIGDAVVATDAQGRVTFANHVALSLMGWPENEIAGRRLEDAFRIVNEYSRATVESPVAKVLREGAVVGLANHTVLLARDGREVPIDDSAAPIHGRGGAIEGTVLVFRDIGERRRAESARQLLSSIVESSGDAIIGTDLDGVVTTWNNAAERMFGYSAAAVTGKPVSLLNAPDCPDESPEMLGRIREGQRIEQYQTLRRTKDNRVIHASVTVSPVYDGGGKIAGAARITRDVTAEVLAKEEISEQRERLRVTLSSIGDAVIVTDHTGAATYLNPVAEELTGWSTADASGKPLEDVFQIIGEESREPVENPASRALREGRVVGLANHTVLVARDGKEYAIDDSAAPIRNVRGETVGVVLIFRDITGRRASERQLLSQTVELRRANEELSQFAYVVSHDLREPLRNVINFAELLVREYGDAGGSEAEIYARFIRDSVQRMELLLNDLLAYSQLGGPHEQPHRLLNMNEVLATARNNLETVISGSGAEITSDILPAVFGYETQLAQVFQNLIGNAIKYRSAAPPRVHIGAQKKDGEWIFSVRDNGIGIAPEYQRLIFGVFKRLHGREIPGTGIGLAICSKVVDRHGGRIWVESARGQGSEFFFTLPATQIARIARA